MLKIPSVDPTLAKHETPITLRFTNYYGALAWNCIAVYADGYKNTLNKQVPVVRVLDATKHTTANRGLCMAQSWATYNSLSIPGAQEAYIAAMGGGNPLYPLIVVLATVASAQSFTSHNFRFEFLKHHEISSTFFHLASPCGGHCHCQQ